MYKSTNLVSSNVVSNERPICETLCVSPSLKAGIYNYLSIYIIHRGIPYTFYISLVKIRMLEMFPEIKIRNAADFNGEYLSLLKNTVLSCQT